ncbi:hypothetical protein FNT36_14610 [Hymenobacter setariae]|uniref:GSCFA domain-containing protein n=1 Tax=Hymenobacter setariae TaxID=2594794 RepID=A0A558BW64_9BACT|nr:GSCFA domain-containing protein [Hymenobacter setariae]TVT40693.1 hypothetical protein FNT36_14610 [Hymenobacter setariae]
MFRTELTIAPQERLLPRTARVLTVGSCFADSIGERLRLNKVNTLVNPFGTVFQPLALAQLLRAAAGEEQDWQQHVVEARGRWQSYDFHSTIGAESPVELLQTIQETVRRVGDFVRTADAVVLTLGTAWAYRLRETGELVSNLHKLPSGLFEKELLTADEIVNGLAEVHALLRLMNPAIRIVLTVSPVRHIKDTLPLNAVSKSVLRVACHYLSELLPNVSYFPAYELLTDDLRDYRFYAADMLHPSEVAEDYIWERFARTYFDADFGRFRKEWAAVRQSLGHRPLHPGAPEHRAFLDQTRERLERMTSQGVDVRQELRDVKRQLAALPPPRPTRVPEVEPLDDEERIDIGSDEADNASPTLLPHTEPTQQQNRRHENRRDGRRNERTNRDRRDNRPAPVASPALEEVAVPVEALPEEPVTAEVEALLTTPEAELLVTVPEEGVGYPAKKKKRRSRGGAKRTARKNAARLAAEQETSPLSSDEIGELTAEATEDFAAPDETLELSAVEETFAEPLALGELPNELAFEINDNLGAGTAMEQPVEASAPASPEQPAPVRKRGTGPTPKKSKVITKSGLVKRGKRTSLYRSPTPEATEAAVPEPTAVPATAPIISPPIIPEILLERPAVALAEFPPSEPEVEEFAAEVAADAAPAKPKRGRPKATRKPTVPAESPAPTEAEAPSLPVEAAPAASEPNEGAANDKPATPKAKPRPARAAKTATPKKPAAKADTPRRGRPPGKKTPPAAPEAPAE